MALYSLAMVKTEIYIEQAANGTWAVMQKIGTDQARPIATSATERGAKQLAGRERNRQAEQDARYQLQLDRKAAADAVVAELAALGIASSATLAVGGSAYVRVAGLPSRETRNGSEEPKIRIADHPGRHWEAARWERRAGESASDLAARVAREMREATN